MKKKGSRSVVRRCRYSASELTEIFSRFAAYRPEPQGELNYTNPYTLLVAVVLSAQATDVGVNKATKELFEIVKSPEDMIELGESRLRDYIKTIGLYRTKAKNVILLSRMLLDEYGGEVPRAREELTRLPGVGRKTANVVMSIAFGIPTIAVDTHIFRISNRLGIAEADTPEAVEALLEKRIPSEFLYHAHHWLILHGRYTCKARVPLCEECVIADLCKYKLKTCSVPLAIV